MVKGGFQGLDITGVDLTAQSPTLPGAYATCAGADGKPIRVQTADGQVECSVKKVSTNYVLAGITGDGKILSITIGSTDGISVSETTPAAETSGELKAGSFVNITNATLAEPFVAPADGYVNITIDSTMETTNTSSISAMIPLSKNGGKTIATVFGPPAEGEYTKSAYAFVKKGTRVYLQRSQSFTGGTGGFTSLVEA